MPAPHDKSTLRSFLGALTYYGKFIKEMREIRSPLDELLKKDVPWNWESDQQKSFEKAKEIMLSDLLMTHFDPKLPIIVAADASKGGIGATISHQFPDKSEHVIEHASCTFSAAQQNYSQIEKEALGLVFAVQKFHRMLYGRKFTLLTDHKPMLAIFGSTKGIPIYSASRLQRWALVLSNYEFDIKYVNTKAFGNADVLSRLIANYPRPSEDILIANICNDTDCCVNFVFEAKIEQLPITAKIIAEETAKDEILQQISAFTKHGWPQKLNDIKLSPFLPKKAQLSEIEAESTPKSNEWSSNARNATQQPKILQKRISSHGKQQAEFLSESTLISPALVLTAKHTWYWSTPTQNGQKYGKWKEHQANSPFQCSNHSCIGSEFPKKLSPTTEANFDPLNLHNSAKNST